MGSVLSRSAFARIWEVSYASDWTAFLVITIGYIIILIYEPFHRMFSLDDRRIQYPHAEVERVPLSMLFIYSIAVPLVVIIFLTIGKKRSHERMHQLHVAVLGLSLSLMMTSFFTDLVKNGVGRARPDLIARCKPKDGTPEHELVTWEVCTEQDHHRLHDGWRSFPSGHSSFSFAGLGYLSLFLFGQLHAARPGAGLGRFIISVLPLLGALAIAISRTEDYRHDVYDVTTGAIIGITITIYSYRRYFPKLSAPNCDEPYKPNNDASGFEMLPQSNSPDLEMQNLQR